MSQSKVSKISHFLFILLSASFCRSTVGFSWNAMAIIGEEVNGYLVNATDTDCNDSDCYCDGLRPIRITKYAVEDGVSYTFNFTCEQPAPVELISWHTRVYYNFWSSYWMKVGSHKTGELDEDKSYSVTGKIPNNNQDIPNGEYCFIFWGELDSNITTKRKELLLDVSF